MPSAPLLPGALISSGASHNQVQCQICQKFGHSAIDCFQRLNMNYIGRQSTKKLVAMVANKNNVADESVWYTDTGALHHITSELRNLQISSPNQGSDLVQIGNGDTLLILMLAACLVR